MLNFKTLLHSVETLLQMLVGKCNFSAMQAADPVMRPLIFFFYVVTVYYILLNMFLTILNESFARVRADITLQTNDYEMVDFIVNRCVRAFNHSPFFCAICRGLNCLDLGRH